MKSIIQQLFGSKAAKESSKFSAWMSDLAEMDDVAALKFSTQKLSLFGRTFGCGGRSLEETVCVP